MKQSTSRSTSAQTSGNATNIVVPTAIDLDTFLAKLSAKDKKTFERQVNTRDQSAYPGLADRWKRLSCLLSTLAPSFIKLSGTDAIQFFIADGKYRKQVYALNATPEGTLGVYMQDVLQDAIKAKLVAPNPDAETEHSYRLPDAGQTLSIESLDGKTMNQPPFYKDMTGWNRKAICVVVPALANDAHMNAAEKIATLAATKFVITPPPAPATPNSPAR